MDRRLFLTAMLGLAGTAAVATVVRPVNAFAGVPGGRGILDELEASPPDMVEGGDGEATVTDVGYHHHHHHRRRRRKHFWRRVCRRHRHHGRWIKRCYRERAWVWIWL